MIYTPAIASNDPMMFLAAVQSELNISAYQTNAAFADYVLWQTRMALANRDPTERALVAFPELIGLPLLFFLNRAVTASTIVEAAIELARETWPQAVPMLWQYRNVMPSAFILPRAIAIYQAYTYAFAEAARQNRCFIAAGSVFLPAIDEEAAKGTHIANGNVQNISFTFAPTGRIVARTAKINLTAGLEQQIGLAKGREIPLVHSKDGNIATLICYDAFFEQLLERADGAGAQVLVQPSANSRPWLGPWSNDRRKIEGEEWLARGPSSRLGGRINLRALVNPMLVGQLFELAFEGASSIAFRPDLGQARVLTKLCQNFEIIFARLDNGPS
jgi:hypothetical protein